MKRELKEVGAVCTVWLCIRGAKENPMKRELKGASSSGGIVSTYPWCKGKSHETGIERLFPNPQGVNSNGQVQRKIP